MKENKGASEIGFMAVVFGAMVVVLGIILNGVVEGNNSNLVFHVKHKFGGRRNADGRSLLSVIKAHDAQRHGRMLYPIDLPLGGDGSPTDAALYFTKLSIGTPPKDYYVQVDTGSDILWVNCAGCDTCPKKSTLGIDLTYYNVASSSTGKTVSCDEDFCTASSSAEYSDCKHGIPCPYSVAYGDGSTTAGYFVKDYIILDQVSGNLQTTTTNGTVAFGCSSRQSGDQGSSSPAVDGIIGFGEAKSSIISQLASAGKVKKIFSHCLDGINGGGIFAIGQVVQPTYKTTPLLRNEPHYNIMLKAIEVGGIVVDLPTDYSRGASGIGTIIDSGTTLAYLPDEVYGPLMRKVLAGQPNLRIHTVSSHFKCFFYNGNVDDGFPVVKFVFEDSLTLTVHPHDYLFDLDDGEVCIGWQNKGMQTRDERDIILLGDLVLSNKLVVYDLENHTIGWAEYDCSSSIKVKDEKSRNVYTVGASVISSAFTLSHGILFVLLALFFCFSV